MNHGSSVGADEAAQRQAMPTRLAGCATIDMSRDSLNRIAVCNAPISLDA